MAFKIERKPLNELHPNDTNPRSIKDPKFQKLVSNIQAFPEMLDLRPVVWEGDGRILGGNMRYRAVKHLGWADIPAINASELTEEQKQAFIILDNQDFGEWDFEILISNFDPETLVKLGFEPTELGISLDAPRFIGADGQSPTDATDIGNEEDYDASHVKMVQLFMNTETHPVFIAQIENLQKHFSTDNITDTVLKAVEYANDNCFKSL